MTLLSKKLTSTRLERDGLIAFRAMLADFALKAAETAFEAAEGVDNEDNIRHGLRDSIASGGSSAVRTRVGSTESSGVSRSWHSFDGEESPQLEDLDPLLDSFSVDFEVALPEYQYLKISLSQYVRIVNVSVQNRGYGDSETEQFLERVVAFLGRHQVDPPRPVRRSFRVFLGHGGDAQWKILQRVLIDTHHFDLVAFESEERAGYTTLETVDLMIRSSVVGVVILTAADQMKDGSLRARENVVHEIGYCQGALGISNTIIVLEDGVSEFSNIAGLTQVRFPKQDILAVESKIVAALDLRKRAHDVGDFADSA